MKRLQLLVLLAVLSGALSLTVGSVRAQGLVVCQAAHESFESACFIGTPDAQGVTLRDRLDAPGQVRAYRFRVEPEPRAGYIYVGDLWFDVEVALWRDPPSAMELERALLVGESRTSERRALQFVRPQILVQQLEPGTYTLFVRAPDRDSVEPRRDFTVRVALGPPVCGMQQDPAERYHLGLSYPPTDLTPFSLLSFNAFLSPPYSNLFDFDWQIDGQPIPGEHRATVQVAVADLSNVPGNEHQVRVTARGVREYPDPDPRYRHVPPTLAVECTFRTP
jgi:hypothetical protein